MPPTRIDRPLVPGVGPKLLAFARWLAEVMPEGKTARVLRKEGLVDRREEKAPDGCGAMPDRRGQEASRVSRPRHPARRRRKKHTARSS